MARHPQSWLRSTLNVWLGYFLTAIAAIPASALGLFLIRKGSVQQQVAIVISISLAVLGGFIAEQLIALRSRKQKRIAVSASPAIAYLNWDAPAITAAGFIEGLTLAALAVSSLQHKPGLNEETAHLITIEPPDIDDYKIIASSVFRLPTSQQQRRIVIEVKTFKAHQGTGNRPAIRADQLTQAAALSPYFDEATAWAGQG